MARKNPSSFIGHQANRNFLYLTLSVAHTNPEHPLNHDFIMQWRIDLKLENGKPVPETKRFCVKTRKKIAMRDEWEVEVPSLDPVNALITLQAKCGRRLPECLLQAAEELMPKTFVRSSSVTSRSGHNGIQLRKKWQTIAGHSFSNDMQAVGTWNGPGPCRIETEDEIKGLLGCSVLLADNFTRIAKGALDVHMGHITNAAKAEKITLYPSEWSKAVFAEQATIGNLDGSEILPDGWKDSITCIEEIRKKSLQPIDYFTESQLVEMLAQLVSILPEKGSLFEAPRPIAA